MASVKVLDIVNVFTQAPMDLIIQEDCERTTMSFGLQKEGTLLPDELPTTLISERDGMTIRWKQMDSDEFDNTNYLSGQANWNDFKEEYDAEDENTELSINISIDKHVVNHHLSVYDIDIFTGTLLNKNLLAFISTINNVFSDFIYFDIYDEGYNSWNTESVAFIKHDTDFSLHEDTCIECNRDIRHTSQNDICSVDGLDGITLIPEDFYLSEPQTEIQRVFMQVCCLLSQTFLFDSSQIAEAHYIFKLLGLIAYPNKSYNISHVKDLEITTPSIYFNIYKWVYSNGGLFDKIGIARNIMSLNINEDTLALNVDTFSSILSNYKIYEKENSLQYIELRNKISEILLGLQEKIDKISDDYIDGMKKNIFTIISFLITTVVIRLIAKQDVITGFSPPVLVLISALLVASLFYMCLCRYDISKKIKLFERHYSQISKRYEKLLCKNELENVFKDSNPNKDGSHASILRNRMKWTTWIWGIIVAIFGIATIILFIISK